jgi:hypothetical protein
MPIRYTRAIQGRVTPELASRLERSLGEFPELGGRTITVGRTRRFEGIAVPGSMLIRLRLRRLRPVSYFTIGHELMHLLQSEGLGLVPSGEVQCDVWTLARSPLFLDDQPSYLCGRLWSGGTWPLHAPRVRELCLQAIELRKTNRRYLSWLQRAVIDELRIGLGIRPIRTDPSGSARGAT